MATNYFQDPFGAADYSAEGTRGLLDFLRDEYPRIYGAGAGLLGNTPYDTANAYSVFDPKRKAAFDAAQVTFPAGIAAEVIPGVKTLKAPAMQLGRAGERLAERVVPQIMDRGGMSAGLLDAFAPQPSFATAPKKAMSQGANLTGALRPQVAPVRGETSKELVRQQKKILSTDEKETFEKLKQKYPDFAKASQFMTGQEVQKVITNEDSVREISKLLDILPSSKEM
jgi:hypothetical protein